MSSEARAGAGLLFVVSAPSGTGKTTVVKRLVQVCPGLQPSRSFTSRPIRPGERDGVDYNFVSRGDFDGMAERGEFLEWAEVFGNRYGTGREATAARLAAGTDLVLVIDVQGARQVRERTTGAVSVFVLPPSFEVLEERLRSRSKDTEAQMQRRLDVAQQEVDAVQEYEYVVINDELEPAVARLRAIVEAERSRRRIMQPVTDAIIANFRAAAARRVNR